MHAQQKPGMPPIILQHSCMPSAGREQAISPRAIVATESSRNPAHPLTSRAIPALQAMHAISLFVPSIPTAALSAHGEGTTVADGVEKHRLSLLAQHAWQSTCMQDVMCTQLHPPCCRRPAYLRTLQPWTAASTSMQARPRKLPQRCRCHLNVFSVTLINLTGSHCENLHVSVSISSVSFLTLRIHALSFLLLFMLPHTCTQHSIHKPRMLNQHS